MGLLFCCPECGANLRVTRSAAVAAVACPDCGEPIRVPRTPHPAESAYDTPAVRAVDANRARAGLARLKLSLSLFCFAATAILGIATLRLATMQAGFDPRPAWVPVVTSTLGLVAGGLGLLGCWLRIRGYRQCRQAGADVGVEKRMRLAATGAGLVAVGQSAAAPWVFGLSLESLRPEIAAVVMLGLMIGAAGCIMEFAFLTALHRLLWETSGWQAAHKAGQYAITFAFGAVSAMAALVAGYMVLVLASGGQPGQMTPEMVFDPRSLEIRLVATLELAALATIAGLVCWRYGRLLSLTRRSLATPQAYAGEVPSERRT